MSVVVLFVVASALEVFFVVGALVGGGLTYGAIKLFR